MSINIKTELNEVRGVNVSARIIRRRLTEAAITPFRPANGPKLSQTGSFKFTQCCIEDCVPFDFR